MNGCNQNTVRLLKQNHTLVVIAKAPWPGMTVAQLPPEVLPANMGGP